MSGPTISKSGLTRRSFLKTTAAVGAGVAGGLGATSALANLAYADKASPETDENIYVCCCLGNCMGGCAMNVHVKDDHAYRITPYHYPEEDLRQVCQRGHSNLQRLYSPKRVKYPMRRVEGTPRGAGEWERLTWDEAIEEIATKWKGYQEEFGTDSIVFAPGSGNVMESITSQTARLCALMGASYMNPGEDVNGMSSVRDTTGLGTCYLGGFAREFRHAKNIFVWGTNPVDARGVHFHWLMDGMEAGAHAVVIDPNYTLTASKVDEFVPIRPGTDALLAFAMMKVILENNLQDESYLKTDTVGPFLVKESDGMYLRTTDLADLAADADEQGEILVMDSDGKTKPASRATNVQLEGTFEVEGIKVTTAYSLLLERIDQYAIEEAVKHCEIPEEKIRDLALRFADGPTAVMTAYGLDHYANGYTGYHAIAALLMLTGNLGKHGAGFVGQGAPVAMGSDISFNAAGASAQFITQIVFKSQLYGPYFPQTVESGKAGDRDVTVKSIFIIAQNTLANQCDRNLWLKTFDKIDLIVVSEVLMTETAQYADIVLPVPHYFEIESYNMMGSPYMKINEAAVQSQCECKSDFEILALLGKAMGLGEHFTLTLDDFNRKAFENPTAEALGMTWDRLKEEKTIQTWPSESFFLGENGVYTTATGKAQFYFEGLRPIPDWGQEWDAKLESLPYWEPPHEVWHENEIVKTYPLQFVTERAKFKTHTMFTYCPELLEIDPEPTVKIHPTDAKSRGIETGDYLRVFNDRGYLVVKAVINPGNRQGVLVIDHGWEADQFVDGHYQDLTSGYTRPHYACNNFSDCMVEATKVEGE